ncbi:MAG: ISL3 family transposase [bacterium]
MSALSITVACIMAELHIPLDIKSLEILSQHINNKGEIILTVQSKKTETPCHKCGKPATTRYGYGPELTIRHLPILDTPVYLVIKPVRYKCNDCDDLVTTSEAYDWLKRGAHVTNGLSDYLMRQLIHSTIEDVSIKERIGYKKLENTVNKAIDIKVNWQNYTSLSLLGIDEIALKKGHKDYVTVISTKPEKTAQVTVIAVLPGRLKKDVAAFLKTIPEHLKKTIQSVCTDMYDGFVFAVTEVLGDAVLVVDRYHVAKLYREPLDKLRVREMKRLKSTLSEEEYAQLEGVMWTLRKKHECLSDAEKETLALLYHYSPKLKEAHSHALRLTQILNTHCSKKSGLAKINRWIKRVKKSDSTCFNGFLVTLEKYKTYVGNYFKNRSNSGFVEGLNNLIKVAKRRCYGIFKTETLFQRLFLDLQGFEIYA